MHACNYYPDPVVGNPRIKATFKALDKRVGEPAQVKLPATKEVVVSAMKRTTLSGSHSTKGKGTVNAVIQSAWLFLLRSSEYCFVDEGPTTTARASEMSPSTMGKRGSSLSATRRKP